MIIHFERSGGFAGIGLHATVDTEQLSQPEAETLKELVSQADFFQLPAQIIQKSPGPDQFNYRLTINEGGRSHGVAIQGSDLPENVQRLLQELTRIARSQRSG